MTSFHFKAATMDDRLETGMIAANDRLHATRLLIDRGLYVVSLEADKQSLLDLLRQPVRRQALGRREFAQLLSDLGHLLNAGVELASALALLKRTGMSGRSGEVLGKLHDAIRAGSLLSDAVRAMPKSMPARIAALIRAGEIADRLGEILIEIAENERRTAKMLSEVTTALIYPCCLVLAICGAIAVLIGVVVPTLETLFGDQIGRLPWQTQLLIAISRGVRSHILLIAGGGTVLLCSAVAALRSPPVRMRIERAALSLPLLGELMKASETAQTASLLAMYAGARIPLADAVALTQEGVHLSVSRLAFEEAAVRVRQGASLTEAILPIPTLTQRMTALVAIGDSTGRLGALLQEAARDAERQLATTVSRFLALLTPVMTIVFGLIAGFVLFAVMKAILSVNDFAMGS